MKVMKEVSKQYDFGKEDEIYKLWEESGFFRPEVGQPWVDNPDNRETYCNILPPPNANGELHVGHASGYAVMDIFGRWQRMRGKKVLLLPGKDHAGIQTQVVYEKKIKKERGIGRQDLGREKFYQETYDFCIGRANYMRAQEKKIGISADWSREKFSLDKDVLKIALETFVKMYEDGMVYRGKRIINWCPRCMTALADVETIHQEKDGKLYYIKYPIENSDDFIVVATTRPETMLGDTAVAVNPKDEKHKDLVGKNALLPLMDRTIPIISDRRVEMGFGTGAVKITPAHDPLDWRMGKDHKLPEIQVINEKAEITSEGGKYAGQKVLEARDNILKDLEGLGLLEKIEDAKINISVCERCKTTIEPLISEQWFVNVDAEKFSLKNKALEAIEKGEIEIYPENFKKIIIQWFNNLEDWCISRQIWWGPRIPVWYRDDKKEVYVGLEEPKGDGWMQDEDTFDTWFTSGQWPHATLGYLDGKDFKEFYPTDMMVMGRDLIFFWCSRMIMLGLYRTGQIPFRKIYFTGLVRDKLGRKFSKSLGNGIDPMEMTEKFGSDALRLSLVMDSTPGMDKKLSEEKIESYRNFVTKLWNIFRYSLSSDENFQLAEKLEKSEIKSLSDKWIISKLEKLIGEFNKDLESCQLSMAGDKLKNFTWNDLADWYVEINKVEKNAKVLGYVLDKILELWHPFIPFITENIYQYFKEGELLMVAKWPESSSDLIDEKAEKTFGDLQAAVVKIRTLRASYHIEPAKIINAYAEEMENKEIIEKLSRVKIISEKPAEKMIVVSSGKAKINLDIASLIDAEKESARLQKESDGLKKAIQKVEGLLNNKKFVASAPEEIVAENKERLEEYKKKLAEQEELIQNLKNI